MSRTPASPDPTGSAGAVLIEFALVLPILLLVMTGIFDFGLAFREYLLVTNAAREGARMAILPGYTDADVRARVKDYLLKAGGVDPKMIVEAEITTGPPDSPADAGYAVKTVRARVNHPFSLLAPFGTNYGTVPLVAVSTMRVEVGAEAAP